MKTRISEDGGPTVPSQIDQMRRDEFFLPRAEVSADSYPRMFTLSAGPIYQTVISPQHPEPAEYVTIPMAGLGTPQGDRLAVNVAGWNLLWEAAQFRRRHFDEDELVEPIRELADLGDNNFVFVPRTRSRYYELGPLLHLLPARTLDRYGLPLLRAGQWPFLMESRDVDRYLPRDFSERLSRAWAATVWPHLCSASPMNAFTKHDPVKLLSHNLDYWIPPATTVIQDVISSFPRGGTGTELNGEVRLVDGSILPDTSLVRPRKGGDVWQGEDWAAEIVGWIIDEADASGNLRGILDTVRSNRAHDDFSPRWSHAREDFERKLNHSRAKVKVAFMEVPDVTPVQSPEAEVIGNKVVADFLALLDAKERQVVVLLMNGFRHHEAAEALGYANHSAVSKKLPAIRRAAERYFGVID